MILTEKSRVSHFYSTKANTGLKHMFANLRRDLNAIMERDPAASNRLAAVFLYPSFQVMLAYRLSHILWRMRLSVHCAADHADCARTNRHRNSPRSKNRPRFLC
jgi:hypothetical protein